MIRGQLKPICLKTLFGTYEQPERSTSRAAGLKKPGAAGFGTGLALGLGLNWAGERGRRRILQTSMGSRGHRA